MSEGKKKKRTKTSRNTTSIYFSGDYSKSCGFTLFSDIKTLLTLAVVRCILNRRYGNPYVVASRKGGISFARYHLLSTSLRSFDYSLQFVS